jgi:signal transduction histidine kinase
VVELYGYVAEEKGIGIDVVCPGNLLIRADPRRIRQVLANLLDNALKYTPKGGKITFEAGLIQKQVFVSIKDTGVGIPKGVLPRIWDRLYRFDESRSQRGLGLGLSLVKAIVEAHGGKIEVVSEPGNGSTFRVCFHAQGPSPAPLV